MFRNQPSNRCECVSTSLWPRLDLDKVYNFPPRTDGWSVFFKLLEGPRTWSITTTFWKQLLESDGHAPPPTQLRSLHRSKSVNHSWSRTTVTNFGCLCFFVCLFVILIGLIESEGASSRATIFNTKKSFWERIVNVKFKHIESNWIQRVFFLIEYFTFVWIKKYLKEVCA